MEKLNRFKIKYYRCYPTDLTIDEDGIETTESQSEVLRHLHVIEVKPVRATRAKKVEKEAKKTETKKK